MRAIAAVAAGCLLVGCGGGSSGPGPKPVDDPGAQVIAVMLTATGCDPQSFTLPAGDVIFQVTNPPEAGPDTVGAHRDSKGRPTEMEIQTSSGHETNDVEGVTPGRTRSFLVKLEAGKTYRVRCPETQVPWGMITVTSPVATQ